MEHTLTVTQGQGLSPTELEERRTGLGGTDAGAVLGVSTWATAHDVWLEKRGEGPPPQDPSEPMYWGTALEAAVRRAYRERTGLMIRKPRRLLRHPERPWQLGHPDGIGRDRVVEVKVTGTSEGWGEPGTDQVPAAYKAQVGHYMDLTDKDRADIIVLFGYKLEAEVFTVTRGRWVELMREELGDWWARHIVGGEPPEVDGSEGAGRMIKQARLRELPAPPIIALPHHYGLLRDLLRTRRRAAFYAQQEELLEQQVQQMMGGSEELQAPGLKITYKVRSGYDKVAYKEYATALEGVIEQLALGMFPVNMDPLETRAALRSLHTTRVEETPVFRLSADANTPLLIETEATNGEG